MSNIHAEESFELKMKVIGNSSKMGAFKMLIGKRMNAIFKKKSLKKLHLLKIRDSIAPVQERAAEVLKDIWEKHTDIEKPLALYGVEDFGTEDETEINIKLTELNKDIEEFYDTAESGIEIQKLCLTLKESEEITVEEIALLRDFVEFAFDKELKDAEEEAKDEDNEGGGEED